MSDFQIGDYGRRTDHWGHKLMGRLVADCFIHDRVSGPHWHYLDSGSWNPPDADHEPIAIVAYEDVREMERLRSMGVEAGPEDFRRFARPDLPQPPIGTVGRVWLEEDPDRKFSVMRTSQGWMDQFGLRMTDWSNWSRRFEALA